MKSVEVEPGIIKITGDHSPHPIFVPEALVDQLGGIKATFHTVKRWRSLGFIARPSKMLEGTNLALTLENVALGKRHWRYFSLQCGHVREDTGYDYVHGYGYDADGYHHIIENAGEPERRRSLFKVRIP